MPTVIRLKLAQGPGSGERDHPDRAFALRNQTVTIELELIREKSRISRPALASSER
jgi:hypothetical protein